MELFLTILLFFLTWLVYIILDFLNALAFFQFCYRFLLCGLFKLLLYFALNENKTKIQEEEPEKMKQVTKIFYVVQCQFGVTFIYNIHMRYIYILYV